MLKGRYLNAAVFRSKIYLTSFLLFQSVFLLKALGQSDSSSTTLRPRVEPARRNSIPPKACRDVTHAAARSGSIATFRNRLSALNSPDQRNNLSREALRNIKGGTLIVGDIHHLPDQKEAQALDDFLIALRKLPRLKSIVVGGDIIDSQHFRGKDIAPAQIAKTIIEVLDQIQKATNVPKEKIYIGLGNHDGPTVKQGVDGRKNPERVFASSTQDIYLRELLEAGYAVGATSPEQTFGVGAMAFSHIPSQNGPNFARALTYQRSDTGNSFTPDLPTGPMVLNPKFIYQINFDAHTARMVSGPHRTTTNEQGPEGSFTTISVPTLGGFVSESEGNFAGVIVMGRNNTPYGFQLQRTELGKPASLIPHPIPTTITAKTPEGLDEAPGIVVTQPVVPKK